MGASYLVTSAGSTDIYEFARNLLNIKKPPEQNPDVYILKTEEKKSIGISETKKGIKFLDGKPYEEKYKVLIIMEAEKLTTDAQNALLKILEEPPASSVIILNPKTEGALLPTIVSRCKKINTKSTVDRKSEGSDIITSDIGIRLEQAGELSKREREEVVAYLESLIQDLREKMLSETDNSKIKYYADIIGKTSEITLDLENTNVSAKMALEELLLNI